MPNKHYDSQITRKAKIFAVSIFVLAFALSVLFSYFIAKNTEATTKKLVERSIPLKDVGWVSSSVDGLVVTLRGEAPDENARFRVTEAIAEVVNVGTIVNEITAPDVAFDAPKIVLEIIQNAKVSSVVGLVPNEPSPAPLVQALERVNPEIDTLNLLEAAPISDVDYWPNQLNFISDVVRILPISKITVHEVSVEIGAVFESQEELNRAKGEIETIAPEGLEIGYNLTAPRPLITPFEVSVTRAASVTTLNICSATNEVELAQIRRALDVKSLLISDCQMGLGAPVDQWGLLVSQLWQDVEQLSDFDLIIKDNNILLRTSDQLDQTLVEAAHSRIRAGLPPGFAFNFETTVTTKSIDELKADGGKLMVEINKPAEGNVTISGVVENATMQESLASLAIAKFGADSAELNLEVAEGLPPEWENNIFGAIQAISEMNSGQAFLTDKQLSLVGETIQGTKNNILGRLKSSLVNVEIVDDIKEIEVTAEVIKADGALCSADLIELLQTQPIQFEQGVSIIAQDSLPTITRLAQILFECRHLDFEIAGYTDAQGSEESNLALSEERAKSVLVAIQGKALDYGTLIAKGYGEAAPVADNNTAEGRSKNRRIEVKLLNTNEETQ